MSAKYFIILVLSLVVAMAFAMEHHKFEKCDQKGFCNRLRSQTSEDYKKSHYALLTDSIQSQPTSFSAILRHQFAERSQKSQIYHDDLILTIEGLENGVFRMRIREAVADVASDLKSVFTKEESRRRSTKDVLIEDHVKPQTLLVKQGQDDIRITTGGNKGMSFL